MKPLQSLVYIRHFTCVGKNVEGSSETKYILYWNEAYGTTTYNFCCGKEPFSSCPGIKDCYVTNNRSLLKNVNQFDVIQFHQRSITKRDLPKHRASHQRYIMWYMESASYPFGFSR